MRELFEGLNPTQTIESLPDISIDPEVTFYDDEITIDYGNKVFKIENVTVEELIYFGTDDHVFDDYEEDSRNYPVNEYAFAYAFKNRDKWVEVPE